MKLSLLTLIMVVALAACQNRDSDVGKVDRAAFPPPPAPEAGADMVVADPGVKSIEQPSSTDYAQDEASADKRDQAISKKVIKEGEVSFETSNISKARQALLQRLKQLGGYVEEEREYHNDEEERRDYILKLHIPAQNFDSFLLSVDETADHIQSKSIRIKDVTTEFIDVTTRLNNQKLLENRYKVLLQKATKMADVLEVENKLSEIRTNVEATQGQLSYLNKQVAYSSLEISFFTKGNTGKDEGNGFAYKLKTAWQNSWQLLQDIFFGLITAWPVIVVAVILIFLFKRWLNKRKNRA